MSVESTGFDQMMRDIEKRLGPAAMIDTAEKSILPGAKIVHGNMSQAMEYFKDTGASQDEMKISKVQAQGKDIFVRIYWQGPMDRYAIIHLNEHGYTRNGKRYTPKGFGAIARALRASKKVYYSTLQKGLSQ